MKVKNFMNACLFSWDKISIVRWASTDPRDDDDTIPVGLYLYVRDIPDDVWESDIDYWDIICVNEGGEEIVTISIII